MAVSERVTKEKLREGLANVAKLARGSKWQRLFKAPLRYLAAQRFAKIVYPKSKQGKRVSTPLFFGGSMMVVLPAGMDIYLLGGKGHDSEVRLAQLLIGVLSPGDTFIDVGAHFGYFTRLGAVLVGPQGLVQAFEAAPRTFEVLKDNVKDQQQVKAHNLAVADHAGELTFSEFPISYSEYNTLRPEQFSQASWVASNQARKVTVATTSLDEVVADQAVKFIKIDVEGAEDVVLKGMERMLSQKQVAFVCLEFLTTARENQAHLLAIEVLKAHNYHPHRITMNGQLEAVQIAELEKRLIAQGEDSDNIVFCQA